MIYLILLPSLWFTLAAHAQSVVVEKPASVVQVEVVESAPNKVRLTVAHPVSGQVFTDSVVHIDGTATDLRVGDAVTVHLEGREQFVPVDEQGTFSTAISLRTVGPHSLAVGAGIARCKVDFIYQPTLSELTVAPLGRPAIFPGEALQLEVIGHFKNGLKQIVNPYVAWNSSDSQVGRIEKGGQFVAVSPGHAVISAIYNGKRVEIPIDVAEPDPPPASEGFTNVMVRNPQVILRVLDHASEDGDLISIFLNGTVVTESVEIFHKPQDFPVTLNPGVNKIEVVALNEGWDPPNTATLIIVSPSGKYDQDFKADQQSRGHFYITLR